MSTRPRASAPRPRAAVTLSTLAEKKALGEPIAMVTAYDYPSAQVAEEAGVDVVLVGDSGAMTVLGYPAPCRSRSTSCSCSPPPSGAGCPRRCWWATCRSAPTRSRTSRPSQTAQRFVKEAGCDAVKLERGGTSVERARGDRRAPASRSWATWASRRRPPPRWAATARRAARPSAALEVVRRRDRAPGGGLLRDRLRGDPERAHRAIMPRMRDPGDRHRRRARRPTARCSCSTTCSASTTATPRAS